jgi:hypothetical protein
MRRQRSQGSWEAARRPSRRRGGGRRRSLPAAVSTAAAVLIAACLMLVASGLLPGMTAAAYADTASDAQKVVLFEDLTVGRAEVWDNVVVVGGDAVIAGTVEGVIVVVGGDLYVESTAVISGQTPGDPDSTSIVSVFGDVTIEPGARVSGAVHDVLSGLSDALRTAVVEPVLRPWEVGTPLGLVWAFVAFVAAALIIAAVAPRQVAFVRDRVRGHFFSSLGWGVLGTFIGIPLSIIALIVTILGILLLAPWLAIVLPLMFLFGLVAVASWIGSAVIRRWESRRGALMLAAVLGAVILGIVRFIPGAGAIAIFLATMVGFGATFVAIWDWRRRTAHRNREEAARRQATAGAQAARPAQAYVPPTGAAYAAPPAAAPPATAAPPPATPAPPRDRGARCCCAPRNRGAPGAPRDRSTAIVGGACVFHVRAILAGGCIRHEGTTHARARRAWSLRRLVRVQW